MKRLIIRKIIITCTTMFENRVIQYPHPSICGPCGGDSLYYLFKKHLLAVEFSLLRAINTLVLRLYTVISTL